MSILEKLDNAEFLDFQEGATYRCFGDDSCFCDNHVTKAACFGDEGCFCDNHVAKANCIGCVNATPENYDLKKRSEVYEM